MYDELRQLGDMSIQDVLASIEIPITNQLIANPSSGEKALLVPEAAALYDFLKGLERMMYGMDEDDPLGPSLSRCFSRLLLHFRTKWPEEYLVLLD